MKFILGEKQKMTQHFAEDGTATPATVVVAGPVTVTQIKRNETDGYSAIQVGYGTQKEHRVNRAQRGHMKDLGTFRFLREFRVSEKDLEGISVGDVINTTILEEGDVIRVTGVSKGKGFQGVVKRHGFHGGPRSHGQKHSEREPGSIGATGPQRVFKGTRMPGRMGSDTVTVKNLTVLSVYPESNTVLVKGAVPGRKGTLLEITE